MIESFQFKKIERDTNHFLLWHSFLCVFFSLNNADYTSRFTIKQQLVRCIVLMGFYPIGLNAWHNTTHLFDPGRFHKEAMYFPVLPSVPSPRRSLRRSSATPRTLDILRWKVRHHVHRRGLRQRFRRNEGLPI